MPTLSAQKWYHSNQYNAETECEHCRGVVRHEPWCITQNEAVAYAYGVSVDPAQLSFEDELILHALGVSWRNLACSGKCAH